MQPKAEKENTMKTIEVKINLDPVNDGAVINPERIMKKEEGALIIGTNGKTKIVPEDFAVDILDELSQSPKNLPT